MNIEKYKGQFTTATRSFADYDIATIQGVLGISSIDACILKLNQLSLERQIKNMTRGSK